MANYLWKDFGKDNSYGTVRKYRIGVGNIVNIEGYKMTVKSIQDEYYHVENDCVNLFSDQTGSKKFSFGEFFNELEKYGENNIHLISKKENKFLKRFLFGVYSSEYPYPNFDVLERINEINREIEIDKNEKSKHKNSFIENHEHNRDLYQRMYERNKDKFNAIHNRFKS